MQSLPPDAAFVRATAKERERKSRSVSFATQQEAVDYAKSGYGMSKA